MAPKVAAKAAVGPKAFAKGKAKKDGNRWQFTAARFVYQGHLDFASVLEHLGDKVAEYSIAHEAGTHKHTDVYIVLVKQQNWVTLDPATIEGSKPHVTANTVRGGGYRTRSWERHLSAEADNEDLDGERDDEHQSQAQRFPDRTRLWKYRALRAGRFRTSSHCGLLAVRPRLQNDRQH